MPTDKIIKRKSKEEFDGFSKELTNIKKQSSTKMHKKDWLILSVLFIIVVFFTFINFGGTNTPTTWWQSEEKNDYVIFEVPENVTLGEMWVYFGIAEKDSSIVRIYTSDTLTTTQSSWKSKKAFIVENAMMYRYLNILTFEGKSSPYLIVKSDDVHLRINELVVLDSRTGEPVQLKVALSSNTANTEYSADKMIDEQATFTGKTTNTNGMYFDEVYHARTAFEILNGWTIYETTHPPLGKIIIALGISIFGMNPFGWRIMGAIFSIATVILAYFLGKRVFKNTTFATVLAVLFSCEGLRYTLGRIATIDSFAGFFILMSFYFMYIFFENGIDMRKIMKSFIPFAAAGIFFGFAIAVKWTGLYAGLALLIMFLVVCVRAIIDLVKAKKSINEGEETRLDKLTVKKFPLAVIAALLFGLVFYIAIPLVIYGLSFSVFVEKGAGISGLLEAIKSQNIYMWNYHSRLQAAHNSGSPWWSWIFNAKSVYAYYGDNFFGKGVYARIHIMTTTALCVFGIWSLIYFGKYLFNYTKKKIKRLLTIDEIAFHDHIKRPLGFALIGFFVTWLIWAFISRVAYLYHFYTAMMFLMLLIALYLYCKVILERGVAYHGEMAILNGKVATITYGKARLMAFVGIVIFNFLMFLPAFAGIPVSDLAAMFMFGWCNGFWGFGMVPSFL
ncbi:MAG: phospholipid carrier-dependent glycosyltransferase [Clostridia bacterium]